MAHNWLHRKHQSKPGIQFTDPNLRFVLGHFKKGRIDEAIKWLRRKGITVAPTAVPGTDDTFTCTTSTNDQLAADLKAAGATIVWQQLVYGRRPGELYASPMHYRICMQLPLPPVEQPQLVNIAKSAVAVQTPAQLPAPVAAAVQEQPQPEVTILPPAPKIRILQVSDNMLIIEPIEDGASVKMVIPGAARDGAYIPDKIAVMTMTREQVQELHAALTSLL